MPESVGSEPVSGVMPNVSLAEVRYTANFEQNLVDIERFWTENEFPPGYDRLLDELLETVVPNLERHPRMGRPFLSRLPASVEAQTLVERLTAQIAGFGQNAEIREYVMMDYLALYAVVDGSGGVPCCNLLSIKHHKQLSFDFQRLWLL